MAKTCKRLLSLVLTLILVAALLPVSALQVWAEEITWTEVGTYEELTNALKTGGNIKLTADMSATGQFVIDKSTVLDFNGNTLTLINTQFDPSNFKKAAVITLQDTSEAADGGMYIKGTNNKNYQLIRGESTLTIESGVYKIDSFTAGEPRILYSWGTATVNGGTFIVEGTSTSNIYCAMNVSNGKMYINGGSFSATNKGTGAAFACHSVFEKDKLTNKMVIKGGSFAATSEGNAYGIACGRNSSGAHDISLSLTIPSDAAEVTVTAHSKKNSAYGIYNCGTTALHSDKLTVTSTSDVTGSTEKYAYGIRNDRQITVTAGTYKAYISNSKSTSAQANGFACSRLNASMVGTGTISGGKFYASAPGNRGGAIVTSYADNLKVTGDVEAHGTGRSFYAYRGTVEVSGGTFYSENSSYNITVSTTSSVNITGGTFKDGSLISKAAEATLTITGGNFVGKNGEGMADIYLWLDTSKYSQNDNGTVVAAGTVAPRFEVTANGKTKQYESHFAMVDAVNADTTGNAKVTLLRDVILGYNRSFTTSVDVDLNGYAWIQTSRDGIYVNGLGSANQVTRIHDGYVLYKGSGSVPLTVSKGAIQLENLTVYGTSTMPICYYAPNGDYAYNSYIKNCNLIANRYYVFSYRTSGETGQKNMDILIEDTNLINLYDKNDDGAQIFLAGSAGTTGQYTLGKNVNMYTIADIQELAHQTGKDTAVVQPVAKEGYAIHARQDAASYSDINAVLAAVAAKTGFQEGQDVYGKVSYWTANPTLYKWTTNHTYVDGVCACGAVEGAVAKKGDQYYTDLTAALAAAQANDTVALLGEVTVTGDVRVNENVTLDLNGYNLKATTVTAYGNIVDGSYGGAALLSADSAYVVGGYLPVYDSANGGYRFYQYQYTSLGVKNPNQFAALFGFRLTLSNKQGYALLAKDDSNVAVMARISWSGDKTGTKDFQFQADTVAAYAEAMAAGKTNYAIMMQIGGIDLLGESGTVTLTPMVVSDTNMTVSSAELAWTATKA